jgi:cellulose synthase (UDP-forming)
MRTIYDGKGEVLGPLQPISDQVRYRKLLTRRDEIKVALIAVTYISTLSAFIAYLAWPSHYPILRSGEWWSPIYNIGAITGLVLIIGLQLVSLIQTSSVLLFTSKARDPIPMEYPTGLRVAMLTTIVPSKEPFEIARRTLLAAKKFRLDGGTVDVWLLDEENDPGIKAECARLGINHYSRKGIDRYNTTEVRQRNRGLLFWHRKIEKMPFRAKTKHGNHNSWIEEVLIQPDGRFRYDFVGQADPDHCALEGGEFFHRNVGYFNDPDVAYIVSPQVYHNHDNWIARGAAQLTYVFHGIIQRGTNGLGAPILIGTNHIFRPSAWLQIGGYQDCIIEDHLTAMILPTQSNPVTGNRWKGVYSADITTAGEGPTSWSDFFGQQARWAYGIFEIATRFTPKALPKLTRSQRLSFVAMQFFYPSVSAVWAMGNALSALYLVFGVTSSRLDPLAWFLLFTLSLGLGLSLTLWLRKFNLVEFERKGFGLTGMALNLFTTPVYLAAGCMQLMGKPLVYRVTAKGGLATGDTWATFRVQFKWMAFCLTCMAAGLVTGHHYVSLYVWMSLTVIYCAAPMAVWKNENRKATAALAHRDGSILQAAEAVYAGIQVPLSEIAEPVEPRQPVPAEAGVPA